MIYSIDNLNVNIPIEDFTKIAVRFSGGADSSLLLCMLADAIRNATPDAELYPLTVWTPHRPFNEFYANSVYEKVVELYPDVKVHQPEIFRCEEHSQYSTMQRFAESEAVRKYNVEISFVGVTRNPPEEDNGFPKEIWEWRDKKRDDGNSHAFEHCVVDDAGGDLRAGMHLCSPLKELTKRDICNLYKHFGILESIYPLTYSCEGYPQDNDHYQKHCGKCWWCYERKWGFGRLV